MADRSILVAQTPAVVRWVSVLVPAIRRCRRAAAATLLVAFAAVLLGAPATAQDGPDPADLVGYVRTAMGDAYLDRDGARLTPAIGDPVYRTDVVEVGSQGGLGITFVDNTVLSFGPNTRFVLLEYSFQPRDQDFSFVGRLLRGSFLYTSGDIGRIRPDAVRLDTPAGFIGIRGTRFAAAISDD